MSSSLADIVSSLKSSQSSSAPTNAKIAKSQKQLGTTGKQIVKAQPSLADLVASIQAGTHKESAGGILAWAGKLPVLKQALSTLSSKPVQTVLNVLDTPRAAITSALKETQDQLFTHNNPGGFSVRDLGNQIIHPEQRISGSKLIDQAFRSAPIQSHGVTNAEADKVMANKAFKIGKGIGGFAVDAALDPLSYIGGPAHAVGEVAIKGLSKADLAAKVLEEATKLEKAGALAEGGAKKLAADVAKSGKAALGKEERALLNIPEPGLALAGHRIPGTSAPLGALQSVTGKLGEKVSAGRLGKIGSTLGKSPEEKAALDKILRGATPDVVHEGIAQRAAILTERAVARAGEDRLSRIVGKTGILKDAVKEDGRQLIDAVEGQIPATALSGRVGEALTKLHGLADQAGVKLGELGSYFPHQVTPEATKLIRKTPALREFLLNTGTQGAEKFRTLTAGSDFLGHTLETGSLGEINDLFKKNFKIDLFKTDVPNVVQSYVQQIAQAAGRNKGAEELATRFGLAKPIDALIPVAQTPQALALADVAQGAQDAALKAHTKAQGVAAAAAEAKRRGQVLNDTVKALEKASGVDATGVSPLAAKLDKANGLLATTRTEAHALKEKATRAAVKANKSAAAVEGHVNALRDALSGADAEVRRKGAVVSEALHSPDPQVAAHAAVDAKALVAEKHLAANPPTFEDIKAILANEGARQVISSGMEEGYKLLSKGFQAPADIVDALRITKQMKDPAWWDGLAKTYDHFNNYFKAWAVNSPGFLARNFYSGVFNNYIAGVKFMDHVEFRKLWNVYKADPENYLQKIAAIGKDLPGGGAAYASAFEDARVAMGATGAGQTKDEVIRSLTRPQHQHDFRIPGTDVKLLPKEGRLSQSVAAINPFKADSYLTRAVASKNEDVEAILRGAHAWHSLREGKTIQETIASVTKYHFNYRDLSEFDRAAKRVIPFWTFTARNVPLQLQILATEPWRLNKLSYFKTNIEAQSSPDSIVPSYFGEQNATRLPFQIPGTHGTNYLIPDLPIFRLNETLTHATDPIRLFSDANPLIKTAIERYAGKQLFSDVPFQNTLVEAPSYAKIPGVTQVLEQFGLVKKSKDGHILMTDKNAATLDSVIPALGRVRRLNPVGQETKYGNRLATSVLSFLGSSFATNTPQTQQGELYRRQQQLASLVAELKAEGYIKTKKAP